MHDAYGLPLAFSSELAKQAGLQVDKAGLDAELEKQRAASRKDMKNNLKTAIGDSGWLHGVPATRYCELGGDTDGVADAVVIGQVLKLGKSGLDMPDCCQHRVDQADGRGQNCASSVVTVQAAERLSAQENGDNGFGGGNIN